MRHHTLWIKKLFHTKAVTTLAGAHRIIKREEPRLQLGNAVTTLRTGKVGRENQLFVILFHPGDTGQTVGETQGRLKRLSQTQLQVICPLFSSLYFKTIDYNFYGVFLVQLQLRRLFNLHHLTIDAGADEPLRIHLGQQLLMLPLAFANDWRQQHQLALLWQSQHRIDHLADRLHLKLLIVVWAARDTGAGKQQTQIVIDLGDGADG